MNKTLPETVLQIFNWKYYRTGCNDWSACWMVAMLVVVVFFVAALKF